MIEQRPERQSVTRPEMPFCPELRGPAWDKVLADPHEPFLDTERGRYEAVLNVINNGAKILAVWYLSDRDFVSLPALNRDINENVSESGGICTSSSTEDHLGKSIKPVGVAKENLATGRWKRTRFGTALLPAAMYAAAIIEELDLNPRLAFSSFSNIQRDENGKIVTTSSYQRAAILTDVVRNKNGSRVFEIALDKDIETNGVSGHLRDLASAGAGLVNFDPLDPHKPRTVYSLSEKGNTNDHWGIFTDGRDRKSYPILSAEAQACILSLAQEGSPITIRTVSDRLKRNFGSSSKVASLLKHLHREGFLDKEESDNPSPTEAGERVVQELLVPLMAFAADPNSVPEINRMRWNISLEGTYAFPRLRARIAERYVNTSQHKNLDPEAAVGRMLTTIKSQNGQLTLSDVTRICGLDYATAYKYLRPQIATGRVVQTMELGPDGRKFGKKLFLSVPDEA